MSEHKTVCFPRLWSMPNKHTFLIRPVADFLDRWLADRRVIIDPFAGEHSRGTIRNDLNPSKPADYHLDSVDFLAEMEQQGVVPDAVLFDPPFSPASYRSAMKVLAAGWELETLFGHLGRQRGTS